MKYILKTLVPLLILGLLNGCGGDTNSSEVTAPESSVEESSVVSKLYVTPKVTQVSISWDAISTATSYVLAWGIDKNSLDSVITFDLNTTSYLHEELEPDTLYYYQLTTKTEDEEIFSSILSVRTGETIQIIHSDSGI